METNKCSQEEWGSIASQFKDLNLLQLWEYGEAKVRTQGWQMVHHVWRDKEVIVGAAQVMIKSIPFSKKGLAWINRGPLWHRKGLNGGEHILGGLIRDIKMYWVGKRGLYLVLNPPVVDILEYRRILQGIGMNFIPHSQWYSARVDLGEPLKVLQSHLSKKWRNSLAAAFRNGLTCEYGTSLRLFNDFLAEYVDFIQRKKIRTSVTAEFLKKFQEISPDDGEMQVVRACYKGIVVGTILLAPYGDGIEYMAGIISEHGRHLNAGQYLLWSAIEIIRKQGYLFLDLGGTHPQKTSAGILRFKEGVGGTPYNLIGAFDCARGLQNKCIQILLRNRI